MKSETETELAAFLGIVAALVVGSVLWFIIDKYDEKNLRDYREIQSRCGLDDVSYEGWCRTPQVIRTKILIQCNWFNNK